MVSGRMAAFTAAGSTLPRPVHREIGHLIALLLQPLGGVEHAWCSMAVVMMCFPFFCRSSATPFRAQLSASVPPEVK